MSKYACVSCLLVFAIVVMCTYVCSGDIKIGGGPIGLRVCLFWCFQISTLLANIA